MTSDMRVAHLMKGKLMKGTKFLKKRFEADSRMTKKELAQKILDGVIPGWVEGGTEDGTPWVDEQAWLDSWGRQRITPATGRITSTHRLLG